LTKPFIPWAYRSVNDVVDIGGCMRERLQKYKNNARYSTLTPWALAETAELPQADPEIREKLFGKAKIGLLYSGTVGYAHDLKPFIELARKCRAAGIDAAFCFAGYGNQYKIQTAEITEEDTNIRLAGFASEEELEKRLSAADIHMVSLRPGWEGIVVPSKFFGSLAIGRPALFSGPENSDIAQWCKEYGIGFTLTENTAEDLKNYTLEGTDETIPQFKDVLELFAGKAPLIVELKAERGNHAALAAAATAMLDSYDGVYCIESFDPRCILWLKKNRPEIIRGQLSQNFVKKNENLSLVLRIVLTHLLTGFLTAPDFVAYNFEHRKDTAANTICRKLWKGQGVSWTLRTKEDYDQAVKEGLLPIFEYFRP
jgi:hypothetical protein